MSVIVSAVVVLVAAPPVLEERAFDGAGFKIAAPVGWVASQSGAGTHDVQLRINENGGSMTVWLDVSNPPLRGVERRVRKAARARRWKLVERRWTAIDGARTLVLLYDITALGVRSRQLFYFTRTARGLYTMQYGASKADFDYPEFRAVAASFRPIE